MDIIILYFKTTESMTYFLHQPEGIFLRSKEQLLNVGEALEVGTYVVNATPQGEFYLAKVDSFTRPKKLYGTVEKRALRVLASFDDRPNSTGILLSGEQGSGKTMLARELSIMAAEKGISTIIVSTPYCGAAFNQFIQLIDVPALVLIDEFEKMYDGDDQEKMLTLLDGLFPSKKLFVLTCNKVWRIDEHLINRPGRIFYHLKYVGIETAFVMEYCEDVLKDKSQIDHVVHISKHFSTFNFDMLKALVEEMNRFNMSAQEAVDMLNVSPGSASEDVIHTVELSINGKQITTLERPRLEINPLEGDPIEISYRNEVTGDDDYSGKRLTVIFQPEMLKRVDSGVYTFVNAQAEAVLTLTREKSKPFAWHQGAF